MEKKKSKRALEVEQARKELLEELNPGDTVYTVLRHVSNSGMLRTIDLYVFKNNEPRYLSYWVAQLLDRKLSDAHQGVKIEGCGMDMGFSLVHSLSYALFGNGYQCLGDKCPSAFHVNNRDKTKTEEVHKDGYALKHRWL
jgi:hypothetical protein